MVGLVIKVSAVDAAHGGKVDHAPYIAAVCRGLEAHDVRVVDTTVRAGRDGRREAMLLLQPDDAEFPDRVLTPVRARWNEEEGWSILADGELAGGGLYKGLGVVPDPDDLAAWAVVALARPDLTPSREEYPFRNHSVADASFESQLAAYASRG